MESFRIIHPSQLAHKCGFTNQSHVIKEFTQHFGCTPKVFIKSILQCLTIFLF